MLGTSLLLSCPIWQLRSMWLLALDGHGIAAPVGQNITARGHMA